MISWSPFLLFFMSWGSSSLPSFPRWRPCRKPPLRPSLLVPGESRWCRSWSRGQPAGSGHLPGSLRGSLAGLAGAGSAPLPRACSCWLRRARDLGSFLPPPLPIAYLPPPHLPGSSSSQSPKPHWNNAYPHPATHIETHILPICFTTGSPQEPSLPAWLVGAPLCPHQKCVPPLVPVAQSLAYLFTSDFGSARFRVCSHFATASAFLSCALASSSPDSFLAWSLNYSYLKSIWIVVGEKSFRGSHKVHPGACVFWRQKEWTEEETLYSCCCGFLCKGRSREKPEKAERKKEKALLVTAKCPYWEYALFGGGEGVSRRIICQNFWQSAQLTGWRLFRVHWTGCFKVFVPRSRPCEFKTFRSLGSAEFPVLISPNSSTAPSSPRGMNHRWEIDHYPPICLPKGSGNNLPMLHHISLLFTSAFELKKQSLFSMDSIKLHPRFFLYPQPGNSLLMLCF